MWTVLLSLTACQKPAEAPLPPPGLPPPPAVPAATWPAELVGSWEMLDFLDGRWLVLVPCDHVRGELEFTAPGGGARLHWRHDQETDDLTLLAATATADGYDLTLQPGFTVPPVRHHLAFDPEHRDRFSLEEAGPFVRGEVAGDMEHLYQPDSECAGDHEDSPWADAATAPAGLFRLVLRDGAWVRPPDSGTLPELALDLVDSSPPRMVRRTGAGARSWSVVGAVRAGAGWWLTVEDAAHLRSGVSVFPATGIGSSRPPPEGSWSVRFGGEPADPEVVWVTEVPR